MRFAVHRPGNPVASPRSHGVPRRDVPRRVHISIAGEPAGRTYEPRLALARLRIHVPARRASLASERRIDLFHPSGSLVLQAPHQQPPARPQDLAVEPSFSAHIPARIGCSAPSRTGHIADLQVLNADHVETSCDVRTGLLGPVFTPVSLAGAHLGDSQPHLPAAVRAAPGAGELVLQTAQPPPLPSPTWRDKRRTSHCLPRRPTMRNPSSRPALRHVGRPAGFRGSKNAVIALA